MLVSGQSQYVVPAGAIGRNYLGCQIIKLLNNLKLMLRINSYRWHSLLRYELTVCMPFLAKTVRYRLNPVRPVGNSFKEAQKHAYSINSLGPIKKKLKEAETMY